MKFFKCTNCSSPVYFENTICGSCGSSIGFVAQMLQPVALIVENNGQLSYKSGSNKTYYRYCANNKLKACNWLVEANSNAIYCPACELNRTIPDLSNIQYADRWRKIEIAKHRLIYGLFRMKLKVVSKTRNEQEGLAFDFMADAGNYSMEKILTGHDEGIITINIAEADDIEREMARRSMFEVYRTVLGHFRHEIGHYYWDRLIYQTPNIDKFRRLFGDEEQDYPSALQKHYQQGAPQNWNQHYISAYASSHPWEDWAETWAHFMHIVDTLETAYSFGLSVEPMGLNRHSSLNADIKTDPYNIDDFENIIKLWLPLTFALNSLNRSMGLPDVYPFVISNEVKEKMKFIYEVVSAAAK